MRICGLLYKRATMVIMMLSSGCINQQISKWEGTECRLGEGERMVGAPCESSKEVVTVSQGWGQEKEPSWETMCSEEQQSSARAFQWRGIYVKIYEIFSLQKCFSTCLLIGQILSCKIMHLTLPPIVMMHSAWYLTI